MKKLLVLLAMVMAFTLTSVAQTSSSSSGQTDQTTTSKTKATSDNTGKAGKAKKEATLTGCLNSDASMLTNGNYKNGVKVGPADKVKEHAGHQVALKGQWSGTGADKNFEVASVKHLSETCSAAKGGGTTGTTKKGKDTGATPKS